MNVKSVGQIFQANRALTKYFPEGQVFKNAIVRFEKEGNVTKKVVTRKDGKEIIGYFNNGKLFQSTFESNKGKIILKNVHKKVKNFPSSGEMKKMIIIKTADGGKFSRGIYNTGASFDVWHPKKDAQYTGRMVTLYKKLIEKIKG